MRYLKIDDVCKMLSISRRTFERMRANGKDQEENPMFNMTTRNDDLTKLFGNILPLKFPQPDLFIGRSPRWEEKRLIEWLEKNGSRLSDN